MQKGSRSACSGCVLSNLDGLERVFVHGKGASGRRIDLGTLQGIPTYRHCSAPEVGMRCGAVIGCSLTPGTSVPGVSRFRVSDGRAERTS